MNPRKLAVLALLVALSVGSNYVMVGLFNVKLMDFVVFLGGFCFGCFGGVFVGVVSWGVYGVLNPFGFSLPIWFATMFCEAIYGVVGALVGRSLKSEVRSGFRGGKGSLCVFFGLLGMLLTFAYDLVTNIVFGLVSGWNVLFAVVFGFVPFGLVHMVSNAVFFGLGSLPVISAISKVVGGDWLGVSEE